MRTWTCAAALALLLGFITSTTAQPPDKDKLPAPGTTGNPDNVPFIGKKDAQGNPVRLAKATGHVSNYTENKVARYTLPDPLVAFDKHPVTTAALWFKQRRPEILRFFRDDIYGAVPANAPKVAWEVAETDANARQGTAIRRRIVGRMGEKKDGPRMNLTVFTPAKAKGPTPVLLNLTFAVRAGSRPPGGFDLIEETLSRGWAYAVLGAERFGYQFAGNLQKWVGKWNDLPVDQHMLIALSAPRPVFVSGGIKDQWSDPTGQFLALAAAGPVYRLLGAQDLGVTQLPPLDKPVAAGSLAYHYHSSGHTVLPADWKIFFDFANRHFPAATK